MTYISVVSDKYTNRYRSYIYTCKQRTNRYIYRQRQDQLYTPGQ